MGWWPSFLGGSSSDPVANLDPKLREFLEKESPVKFNQSSQPQKKPNQSPHTSSTSQSQRARAPNDKSATTTSAATGRPLPSASLYQDGRYADLWKTYRPQAEIDAENMSENDKMMSVLEGFQERKAAIGRASLENCAIQQEDWVNCMTKGSWEDQLTMCKDQVRRYERCYTMQSRFLRALGYGSVLGRPAHVDEDIQMHADSLYIRMVEHEAAVEQAKKEGTLVPVFQVKMPQAKTTTQPDAEKQKVWQEKLEQLPAEERAAEEAALRADLQFNEDVVKDLRDLRDKTKEEREARRAEGRATWSDSMAELFGRGK